MKNQRHVERGTNGYLNSLQAESMGFSSGRGQGSGCIQGDSYRKGDLCGDNIAMFEAGGQGDGGGTFHGGCGAHGNGESTV